MAYGGTTSHPKGLRLTGGGAVRNEADWRWFRWTGRSLEVERGPVLPLPLANCAAAVIEDQALVVGGQQPPTAKAEAERTLYSLDLQHTDAGWKAETGLPGRGRILASVAAGGGHLCMAGGAGRHADARGKPAREYLLDAWRSIPGIGWNRLPSLPEPAAAAPAFNMGDSFFVLGGGDGIPAPREAELRDQHPGFSRSVRVFHPGKRSWHSLDRLPFSLVTTTSTIWNGLPVVPGGEQRPAHCSSAVYAVPQHEIIVNLVGVTR